MDTVLLTDLQMLLKFPQVSHLPSLSWSRIPCGCSRSPYVFSNLGQFLSLSMSFMNLTLLKNSGWLFVPCLPIGVGLGFFSWLY